MSDEGLRARAELETTLGINLDVNRYNNIMECILRFGVHDIGCNPGMRDEKEELDNCICGFAKAKKDAGLEPWFQNFKPMSDFAQQIREEDCKAVCDGCANPESMKVKSAELSPRKKTWVHYFLDGNGHYICDAVAIRNLAEKEPEA